MCWYHALCKAEQEEADLLAQNYAKEIYNKALGRLDSFESEDVWRRVKQHYV
jgi:hypothetical protein